MYDITLHPSGTEIGSGNPMGGFPPPVGVDDPGVVRVTPEPSALAALCLTASFLLRRRCGRGRQSDDRPFAGGAT